jgi:hypothetical protein
MIHVLVNDRGPATTFSVRVRFRRRNVSPSRRRETEAVEAGVGDT